MKKIAAFLGFLTAVLVCIPELPSFAEDGKSPLPSLSEGKEDYETPQAGEGFQARIFGREVKVPPRDRRSISAWSLGVQVNVPEPEDRFFFPIGSLYLWRHPDEDTLFRAEIAGLYNDLFYAVSPDRLGPLELILTYDNNTIPLAQAPLVDGEMLDERELLWGEVGAGVGLGYRTQTRPGNQENMFAVGLIVEPSYLYFSDGSDTADAFEIPKDTFQLNTRLRIRLDKILRNVLELPHTGYALGADLVSGHRFNWDDWGLEEDPGADTDDDFQYATVYALAAGGVPFVESERHRLLGSFHGGLGEELDRFSAPRVGGGPQPMGQEYGSTARPVLPGAAIREFYPEDYAILAAEYRYELMFFTYLSLKASAAYLNRYELEDGVLEQEGEYYGSAGAGLTTGFFAGIRLQFDYNYNTSVIRDGEYGGSEIVIRISNNF